MEGNNPSTNTNSNKQQINKKISKPINSNYTISTTYQAPDGTTATNQSNSLNSTPANKSIKNRNNQNTNSGNKTNYEKTNHWENKTSQYNTAK